MTNLTEGDYYVYHGLNGLTLVFPLLVYTNKETIHNTIFQMIKKKRNNTGKALAKLWNLYINMLMLNMLMIEHLGDQVKTLNP